MKKAFRKFMMIFLTFVLCMGIAMTTYATETKEDPITGNGTVYCELSFYLTDDTGGDFKDDIEVTLTDIAVEKTYDYTLTKENSYGSKDIPKLSVLANTTYEVAIKSDNKEYTIVNKDGSEIEKFAATEDGHDLYWKIVEKEAIKESEMKELIIDSGNKEADVAFEKFYEAIKGIENNPDWENFFVKYQLYENMEAEAYVNVVGGTEDEWKAKTLFERFVYYESYVRIAEYMSFGNYERYFSSEDNFYANAISSSYIHIKRYGEVEAEAYKTLMMWQYNYIQENGSPFNFITGLSYLESASVPETEKIQTNSMDDTDISDEDFEKIVQEEEETGIWSELFKILKNNIFSIVIGLVLIAVVVGMIIYRKKYNEDDYDE